MQDGCAGGLSSLRLRRQRHVKICLLPVCVCSLAFHSSNALFENCLTVQLRATLCIQTDMQAFKHETMCADSGTQADTDITMPTPCNNEHWDLKLRNICSMALCLSQYYQQGHLMRRSQGPPSSHSCSSSNVQSIKCC